MDIQNEKHHVFNIRLANLTGLYQILDPGALKCRGRNVYQIFVAFFMLYSLVISVVLFASFLHLWTYNTSMSLLDFFIATNSFYVSYKMCIVIYHSNDIWDCLSITRYGFTSLINRKRNGHDTLDRWRARSVWYTSLLAVSYCWSMVFYVGCPLAFGASVIPIKNYDGSIGDYRQNVLNLYFFASDETYNEYYNTFFVVEALFIIGMTIVFIIFDTLLVTLCLATCCQMQMICAAFESVNHKSLGDSLSSVIDNTGEKYIISNEHELIYDELITIIIDHQAVIKKFELFLNIFERVMLTHIFISSISLIILWFNLITSFFNDGTFRISGDAAVKTIVLIPSFLFQIFMTCYLFDYIHNQKDSIIYALYSSNWTEMDMKSKKLILLTMQLNNANQKKLRYTRTRIVNLEMFFKTMGHCYTVVSVLINYINAMNN
ncbi:uncharacterized protein LOC132942339 [Metopolophium dirhodum]|uniref:uncharacterized protein LOC132942339 n=1 Tax=Metopolophium dirhodum TaxID=44670 RepID=UPI00298FD04A|nr:uncharacterized protein LOC132942339 [Metopolophium dirhodum]